MILIVVVAIVATVFTAGVAAVGLGLASSAGSTLALGTVGMGQIFAAGSAALLGTGATVAGVTVGAGLGAVAAAAVGGAVGSIVGQGVGIATGQQDQFSWKSVGLAALGTGVASALGGATSGIANGLKDVAGGRYLAAAANGVIRSTVTQGLGSALGLQSFDWKAIAVSAITSPLNVGINDGISSVAGSALKGMGETFSSGLLGVINGAAAQAVRMQVYSDGKIDWASIASDAFGNAIGNSVVKTVNEQSSIEALAAKHGFDLSQPGVEDSVRDLYRHQQGQTPLSPTQLRAALATSWSSTGASAEQVAENLAIYDRAGFTADRTPIVEAGPLSLVRDDSPTASQIARELARQEIAADASSDSLASSGYAVGSALGRSPGLVSMLATSGRVLTDVGGFIADRGWLKLSLEGLEIAAGPALYAVRKGLDYAVGDKLRALAGRFNDGMVAGIALSPGGFSEDDSVNAALGGTFFAAMSTGAVKSSVEGLNLVRSLDKFGSRIAGPLLDNLKDIGQRLDRLELPGGVQVASRGYSRLGTRTVAVLEHAGADGSTLRVTAVLASGDDVAKLGKIDWNAMGRVQSIATDTANATLRSWAPSDLQRAAIQGALDAGDVGKAIGLYRMNMGTAQHGAIARELELTGVSNSRSFAGKGPDLPITSMRGNGIPLPLEFHPDSTFSFGKHIARDYPSYLTIVTPKVSLEPYYRLFRNTGGR
jgi:hypothetical protein